MTVRIESDGNRGVSEPFADDLRVNPSLKSEGRVGVAQIMEPDSPHSSEFNLALEVVAQERRMDRPSRLSSEDKFVTTAVVLENAAALGALPVDAQYLDRSPVEIDAPATRAALRSFNQDLGSNDDHRLQDLQYALVEVNVAPTQPKDLAAAQTRRCGEVKGGVVRMRSCRKQEVLQFGW